MQKFKVYFWKHLPKGYFKEVREKYKDRKNDYMNVYICDNREEMYELNDKLESNAVERDYGARTLCYNKNWYDVKTGEFIKSSQLCGYIVFTKDYFYMDTISHESTHAVIGYFNRKLKDCQNIFTEIDKEGNVLDNNVRPDEDLEELFAYMVGNMAYDIACNYKEDEK